MSALRIPRRWAATLVSAAALALVDQLTPELLARIDALTQPLAD